jgi:hypothetical protein
VYNGVPRHCQAQQCIDQPFGREAGRRISTLVFERPYRFIYDALLKWEMLRACCDLCICGTVGVALNKTHAQFRNGCTPFQAIEIMYMTRFVVVSRLLTSLRGHVRAPPPPACTRGRAQQQHIQTTPKQVTRQSKCTYPIRVGQPDNLVQDLRNGYQLRRAGTSQPSSACFRHSISHSTLNRLAPRPR